MFMLQRCAVKWYVMPEPHPRLLCVVRSNAHVNPAMYESPYVVMFEWMPAIKTDSHTRKSDMFYSCLYAFIPLSLYSLVSDCLIVVMLHIMPAALNLWTPHALAVIRPCVKTAENDIDFSFWSFLFFRRGYRLLIFRLQKKNIVCIRRVLIMIYYQACKLLCAQEKNRPRIT